MASVETALPPGPGPGAVSRLSRRKFSFPAALHSSLATAGAAGGGDLMAGATRRRFSNVGESMSRKLSSTIGWRTASSPPPQDVVAQGKALCAHYIRGRLKRSGLCSKKIGLTRVRSLGSGVSISEALAGLSAAGVELERTHPRVFSRVSRQASAGPIISESAAASLLATIGRELLRPGASWARVVAIYAVAGGLAVDCVCQGHPEYLHGLLDGMADLLDEELAEWVAVNGGWVSLANQCRPPSPEMSVYDYLTILMICLLLLLVVIYVMKFVQRLGLI